jgi:hypothetical protein
MSDPTVHRARLLKWIGISLGIHAALLVVTSIGWFLGSPAAAGGGSGGSATAAPPASAAAAQPPPSVPAQRPADQTPAASVPPVPAAKNRDEAMFGKGETDPKKLQEGPDSRSDLDALK